MTTAESVESQLHRLKKERIVLEQQLVSLCERINVCSSGDDEGLSRIQ